jgi:phage terminase large subunit GpA-like protein
MYYSASEIYNAAFNDGLRPDPYIDMCKWADEYLWLPRESTSEYGKYRSSRTPWVREILYELSPMSQTNEVVVIKPTQSAGSTIAIIMLLCIADLYPAPTLFVTVTETLAKSFSKKKITPTVRDTKEYGARLIDKITTVKSRDASNTILEKTFPGGSWRFAGSNSGAIYRSESIKNIILDDYDGFALDIEGEGDPGELADKRTDTFPDAKIYKNSTPTEKGLSNIERDFEPTSQGYWNVQCPFCKELQQLVFGDKTAEFGLKFNRNSLSNSIYYLCKHCKGKIPETAKPEMNDNGKYVHKYPEREKRGFHWNALITPLGWKSSWQKVITEFLDAGKNKEKLKVWTNTRLAETFEEEGSQPLWTELKARSESYSILTVPAKGMFLTAGVDVQDNRIVVVVLAWGRGEECWLVYWGEFFGDPIDGAVWKQLDNEILNRTYHHVNGHELHILSMAVDTGYRTHAVYNYCRQREPKVIATKGAVQKNKPVISRPTRQDVTWAGETIKNGVQLWSIGTDTAKDTIYSRLNLKDHGPGYIHFPLLADDFYLQLTAERKITHYVKGYPVLGWVKLRDRNDVLDCYVYAYAAAIRVGIVTVDWDSLEKALTKVEDADEPVKRPKRKRKRRRW